MSKHSESEMFHEQLSHKATETMQMKAIRQKIHDRLNTRYVSFHPFAFREFICEKNKGMIFFLIQEVRLGSQQTMMNQRNLLIRKVMIHH